MRIAGALEVAYDAATVWLDEIEQGNVTTEARAHKNGTRYRKVLEGQPHGSPLGNKFALQSSGSLERNSTSPGSSLESAR